MKVLVFVTEYPPTGNTSAIHYFLKEWARNGLEVCVVYNCNRLMFPLYKFAARQDKRTSAGKPEYYELDGVKIYSIPSTRFVPGKKWVTPHSKLFAKINLKKFVKKNWGTDFDIIIDHFCTNNYWLVEDVKKYCNCPVFSVFHDCDIRSEKLAKRVIDNSFGIGSRSKRITDYLRNIVNYNGDIFQVVSGVPSSLVMRRPEKEAHQDGKLCIAYVGKLIKRKHVDDVIEALHKLNGKVEYRFNIVGEGLERSNLENLVNSYHMQSDVHFLGVVERDKAFDMMRKSDCMIMVSTEETFGLVYLEAMANGCIPVGTIDEGIDGIIINNQNGFLVERRNIDQLADVISTIARQSVRERDEMIDNCLNTVKNLTDNMVATEYLNQIKKLIAEYRNGL